MFEAARNWCADDPNGSHLGVVLLGVHEGGSMRRPWEPVLDQLVRERYGRLVTRAMLLTGNAGDAEDLVQDALISAFGGRATFASLGEAEQYVRRAIVSRFIDRARRAGRERTALDQAALLTAPALPSDANELEAALARTAPRERACVVLRHVEGLSVAECATYLGLSEGAVKRYTYDGLRTLNALLGTGDPSAEAPVRLVPAAEVQRDA
jgi:RNA polymerase sigma factor (sigma-70 family)